MKRICIFCGAFPGKGLATESAVKNVISSFHQHGIELVYGGASIGVMGTVADELLALGGRVTGVIPQALMTKEIAHPGLSQLHVVEDMHQRKKLMYDLSDAFLILPGGMGTLDELFEILTWRQLGFHSKPIAILNVDGYFDHLLAFLDHGVRHGFIREAHRELVYASQDWNDILSHFKGAYGNY